jgi:sulfide:quinone oxidoreductase
MAALARQGFRHIICNRPDGEVPGQPSTSAMEAAARDAGMGFTCYPVDASNFPGDDMAGLGRLFDGEDKVLAYCRTGTRCANLWLMSRDDDAFMSESQRVRSMGFDVSLAQLHRQR